MSEPKKFPSNFRRIRLELARESGHPEGEHAYGYTVIAPLDDSNRLDAAAWKENRDMCRVVRFRPGHDQEIGHLIHSSGGNWNIQYKKANDNSDAGYRLNKEQFTPGEYVSIKSEDEMHTYKVVSVEPI